MIYRLILALVSIVMMGGYITKMFSRGDGKIFRNLFFATIWMGITVFAIFPNLAHFVSRQLGLGENLSTLIFMGFSLTFILISQIMSSIEKIKTDVMTIVSKRAIDIAEDHRFKNETEISR